MYIDLSVTLNRQTPVYPGDPATKIEPAETIEHDGCTDHYVSVSNHTGTHIDAPLHMIADGKSLDQMSLGQFIGRGRLVDAGKSFDLKALQRADIRAGDIVLFYTGMSNRYYEPVYFEKYPAMSEEMARYLVERQIKMIGVDACSVDNVDGFPIHKILLNESVLIIENMTNLGQLAGKEFTIYALPIKLDIDGAPARVIAQLG